MNETRDPHIRTLYNQASTLPFSAVDDIQFENLLCATEQKKTIRVTSNGFEIIENIFELAWEIFKVYILGFSNRISEDSQHLAQIKWTYFATARGFFTEEKVQDWNRRIANDTLCPQMRQMRQYVSEVVALKSAADVAKKLEEMQKIVLLAFSKENQAKVQPGFWAMKKVVSLPSPKKQDQVFGRELYSYLYSIRNSELTEKEKSQAERLFCNGIEGITNQKLLFELICLYKGNFATKIPATKEDSVADSIYNAIKRVYERRCAGAIELFNQNQMKEFETAAEFFKAFPYAELHAVLGRLEAYKTLSGLIQDPMANVNNAPEKNSLNEANKKANQKSLQNSYEASLKQLADDLSLTGSATKFSLVPNEKRVWAMMKIARYLLSIKKVEQAWVGDLLKNDMEEAKKHPVLLAACGIIVPLEENPPQPIDTQQQRNTGGPLNVNEMKKEETASEFEESTDSEERMAEDPQQTAPVQSKPTGVDLSQWTAEQKMDFLKQLVQSGNLDLKTVLATVPLDEESQLQPLQPTKEEEKKTSSQTLEIKESPGDEQLPEVANPLDTQSEEKKEPQQTEEVKVPSPKTEKKEPQQTEEAKVPSPKPEKKEPLKEEPAVVEVKVTSPTLEKKIEPTGLQKWNTASSNLSKVKKMRIFVEPSGKTKNLKITFAMLLENVKVVKNEGWSPKLAGAATDYLSYTQKERALINNENLLILFDYALGTKNPELFKAMKDSQVFLERLIREKYSDAPEGDLFAAFESELKA